MSALFNQIDINLLKKYSQNKLKYIFSNWTDRTSSTCSFELIKKAEK